MIKQRDKHATVDVLKKQNITFFLDNRKPLLMFLRLIPLSMVDIEPKNLFVIKENAWKKYIESRKEQTWIDPDHLPNFGNDTKYVETTENPIAKVIVRKPHSFMALLVF